MFLPTKDTMKLSNRNKGHSQGIGIILFCFTDCSIIYPVGPVYYFPGQPSNTISPGVLKFYVGFKKLHMNLLNIVTMLTLKVVLGDHLTRLKTILTILKYKFVKANPHRDKNTVVPTVCALSKKYLSTYSSAFWSCHYYQTKNVKKRNHGRYPRKKP